MVKAISAIDMINLILTSKVTLLDIRHSSFYDKYHLSESISIPCNFNKSQYKKLDSNQQVVLIEQHYPDLQQFALKHVRRQVCLLYQQRGMRSDIAGHYLASIGVLPIEIEGGFSALIEIIRNYSYEKYKATVLIGFTGSGKSEKLAELASKGEQIIDLEGMALHRGSAFGAYYNQTQPSSDQFAIDLFFHIKKLNLDTKIYIEYEHIFIGSVQIPVGIQVMITVAKKLWLSPSREERVTRIANEYSAMPSAHLLLCLKKIEKSIASDIFKIVADFISNNRLKEAVEILLNYYDEIYLKQFEGLK